MKSNTKGKEVGFFPTVNKVTNKELNLFGSSWIYNILLYFILLLIYHEGYSVGFTQINEKIQET